MDGLQWDEPHSDTNFTWSSLHARDHLLGDTASDAFREIGTMRSIASDAFREISVGSAVRAIGQREKVALKDLQQADQRLRDAVNEAIG